LHHHSERDIALPLAEKPPLGGFSSMHANQPEPGVGDGRVGADPPATASMSSGANSRTPGSNSLVVLPCIFHHSLS
jgi:hypothetical protein